MRGSIGFAEMLCFSRIWPTNPSLNHFLQDSQRCGLLLFSRTWQWCPWVYSSVCAEEKAGVAACTGHKRCKFLTYCNDLHLKLSMVNSSIYLGPLRVTKINSSEVSMCFADQEDFFFLS